MRVVPVGSALALLVVAGCHAFWPPRVSERRIQSDLVGKHFTYARQLLSSSVWTIQPGEIKGWRVVRRFTDREAGNDVVHAAVRLEGETLAISGTLKITYRLYDQGWQLETVVADAEFTTLQREGVEAPPRG